MIDLSIRRPVATAAIYIALVALGAYSFRLIPVELLPDVDYPRLSVSASWGGASPEAMEAFVTAPLEGAAQQVKGVRKITSTSRADPRGSGSSATIDIEFNRETRMDFARLELSERINSMRDELPPRVVPNVSPYTPPEFAEEDQQFLSFLMRGSYTEARLAEIAEEEVEPAIASVDGVSDVLVRGSRAREIAISLDRDRLEALGLRPADVTARINDLAQLRAPGSLILEGRQYSLAVRTRVDQVSDLETLVIEQRPEGPVLLRDIGRVREQTADPTGYFRINGQPTIGIEVRRETGTNAVAVAAEVKEVVAQIGDRLPPSVALELDNDESREIGKQLTDLRLRAMAASVVIFLVLMLFLRSLGAVMIVFATIGFSTLIAVNMLYLGGFSLNVLTLAGLAWGFGLIVDNGIVVLENVERHSAGGEGPAVAAERGAKQVVLPVVAATATTAIVLVPFLFMQGDLRLYYLPLAFAVGFSIMASLFVAFTFVPTMTSRLYARRGTRADVHDVREGHGAAWYIRGYRSLLELSLDHPFVVLFVCMATLGGSWYLFDEHVTRGTVWRGLWGQSTYITVNIQFPRGAGLERTDELTRSFEARIASMPEVKRYETQVQPQFAFIRIEFPKELETTQVPVAIKEQMVAYSYQFTGAEVRVYGFGPSFYGGGGSPPNYRLKILGYNYLAVQNIADELAGRLERFSRIEDVDPNASGRWYERDKEFEYFLNVNREAIGTQALSVEELLRFVTANIQGQGGGVERLRVGGEELDVSVKLAGYDEFDLLALQDLRVPTDSGEVRLADVADVQRRDVLARIIREDQQYQRIVAWEFRGPRKLGDLVRDVVLDATELPAGYKIEEDDNFRWSTEEATQVYLALGFAVLLIYMVTAGLFESLAAPFVVLLTLPLALIGVFLIFFYTGGAFTRTAYIGTIMMAGIVVNNAILIVYHIGELRQRLPAREAILQGTLERVRPILMTTFTTVFGLLPLVLFAQSSEENIWNSLAMATIGGLLSSTLFVLVAIPVAYRYLVVRGDDGTGRKAVAAPLLGLALVAVTGLSACGPNGARDDAGVRSEAPARPDPPAEERPTTPAEPDFMAIHYLALGTEPFWSVDVTTDSLVLQRPGEAPVVFEVDEVRRRAGADQLRGSAGPRTIDVTVTRESCSDGMSDTEYAFTSRVILDGEEFSGCAREEPLGGGGVSSAADPTEAAGLTALADMAAATRTRQGEFERHVGSLPAEGGRDRAFAAYFEGDVLRMIEFRAKRGESVEREATYYFDVPTGDDDSGFRYVDGDAWVGSGRRHTFYLLGVRPDGAPVGARYEVDGASAPLPPGLLADEGTLAFELSTEARRLHDR